MIYEPGQEPEELKKHLNLLLRELRKAFPEGLIVMDMWNHERWDRLSGYLMQKLGYQNVRSFLKAYGFEVFDDESAWHRFTEEKPVRNRDLQSFKEPPRRTHEIRTVAREKKKKGLGVWIGAILAVMILSIAGFLYVNSSHGTSMLNPKETLTPVTTPSSETTPVPKSRTTIPTEFSAGDHITYGMYEQDNNLGNGAEPVEWLVLDIQGNQALLISRYGLECKRFNDEHESIIFWQTCTLRTWLNGDFLEKTFTTDEQKRIVKGAVSADKNPDYTTGPGAGQTTQDKIFVLSIHDVNQYFDSDYARMCQPTEYAKSHGCFADPTNGNCWWWLRSHGATSDDVARVRFDGRVDNEGSLATFDYCSVRPALWISISDSNSTQNGSASTTTSVPASVPAGNTTLSNNFPSYNLSAADANGFTMTTTQIVQKYEEALRATWYDTFNVRIDDLQYEPTLSLNVNHFTLPRLFDIPISFQTYKNGKEPGYSDIVDQVSILIQGGNREDTIALFIFASEAAIRLTGYGINTIDDAVAVYEATLNACQQGRTYKRGAFEFSMELADITHLGMGYVCDFQIKALS